MQSLNLRCISLKHIYPSLLQNQVSLLEASGKLLLTHPGFFKQRMQSHHFQYFNVISQKKIRKEILHIWTDSCVNRSLSVFVQSWQHRQMAGDSCDLVKRHEGLVLKQNACVCVCVVCSVGFWYGGSLFMSVECVGAQSRASSGWVFSLSPWSSCFSVPGSTTDWDLKARTHTC